jgi:hypothetical protein
VVDSIIVNPFLRAGRRLRSSPKNVCAVGACSRGDKKPNLSTDISLYQRDDLTVTDYQHKTSLPDVEVYCILYPVNTFVLFG